MMRIAFISIGSNVGDRLGNIREAVSEIAALSTVVSKSRIYETKPMYSAKQPKFLNMVVKIRTQMSAQKLLARMHAVEHKLGRRRSKEKRFGPRAMDLDILLMSGTRLKSGRLTIPHPRMHERAFVLVPLYEVCRTSRIRSMLKLLPAKDKKDIRLFARA